MSTSFLGSNNTNILYMQYDNGYMGVGNYNPVCKLDVAGDVVGRSNLTLMGDATFSNDLVIAKNGNVVLSTSNDNLGISTFAPVEKLDVIGKVQASSQFLAPDSETASTPGFAFTTDSNTGMFHASNSTLAFTTGGTERVRIDSQGYIGIGTSNPSLPLEVSGNALVTGELTILGALNVSNVTYITSNVYIYSSESIQSNLSVTGVSSFSNVILLGSNNGTVELSTSNNRLGINLAPGVSPRADLDISNGTILAKNVQRISKSADNSNPVSITMTWDKPYTSNNLYHVVADVYQTIANGDQAGFRTQRLGIALSNSSISWAQAMQVFGSSEAYTTLNLSASAWTSNSVTLESSTNWVSSGDFVHGMNVDVVHFPDSSNIGNLYLS